MNEELINLMKKLAEALSSVFNDCYSDELKITPETYEKVWQSLATYKENFKTQE